MARFISDPRHQAIEKLYEIQYCQPMYKIMFVCMGNVCRSPLAQVLLEDYIKKNGLQDKIAAESSGVNVFSEGQRACEVIRKAAAEMGVPFDHYSRRFVPSDIMEYDLILAMDNETMRRLKSFARKEPPKGEIRYFRDFDPVQDGSNEVPDPWGAFPAAPDAVAAMIDRTIEPLAEYLLKLSNAL